MLPLLLMRFINVRYETSMALVTFSLGSVFGYASILDLSFLQLHDVILKLMIRYQQNWNLLAIIMVNYYIQMYSRH